MKRIMAVGAVAMAVAGLWLLADGQEALHRDPAAGPPITWPGNGQSNVIIIPVRSNPVVVPSAPPIIPPGVYKTAPYCCIVVVPGPQLDDKCIVNPGGGNSPMPVVKPDVQFIPWGPAK